MSDPAKQHIKPSGVHAETHHLAFFMSPAFFDFGQKIVRVVGNDCIIPTQLVYRFSYMNGCVRAVHESFESLALGRETLTMRQLIQ